jgi:hypothetical protein
MNGFLKARIFLAYQFQFYFFYIIFSLLSYIGMELNDEIDILRYIIHQWKTKLLPGGVCFFITPTLSKNRAVSFG